MTLKIVGAGLGRTGTASLQLALEQLLGGRCYHMKEVFERPDDLPTLTAAARGEAVDWPAFFEEWVATVDWPTAAFWEDIAAAFPDAPILLSTRSSAEVWWKSASDTILIGIQGAIGDDAWSEMVRELFGNTFTLALDNPEAMMRAYDEHNARVRATAPTDRLLEWQPGDGWEPLCERLGVPVPDAPFPHTNTTEEFRARFGFDSTT